MALNMINRLASVGFLLLALVTLGGAGRHGITTDSTANSQFNPNFISVGGEYPFVNFLKASASWNYQDNSGTPDASELDSNGYPLFGSAGLSHSGDFTTMFMPLQMLRPGHYVLTATGAGTAVLFDQNATSAGIACTGTLSVGGASCNNQSCSAMTGSIAPSGSNGLLTVTAAPTGTGCSLVVGQPISSGSIFTSQFGVPTIIIGKSGSVNCPSCTGTGGTGTYLVNWSQTVASASITPGMRLEVGVTAGTEPFENSGNWKLIISAVASGNILGNMGVTHQDDEALYATGQLVGPLFKQRVQQGNFAVMRDLNWAVTNSSNVTTWDKRKPTGYFSYVATEHRLSLFATPVTYALNGSSNDYSVNLGAALPADKQTVCIKWPNTSTNTTITFSVDAGVTKLPVLSYNAGTPSAPSSGTKAGLVFDATLQSWISTLGTNNTTGCLNNNVPPEAFIEVANELGIKKVWITEPFLAADPITDYSIQHALYMQSTWPAMQAMYETPNELWNCTAIGPYSSAKSRAYIAADPGAWSSDLWCGSSGAFINWGGKTASLLGQAIRSVSSTFPVIVGGQTTFSGSNAWKPLVLSTDYVNQNPANIPIQSGCAGASAVQTGCPAPFLQLAAYKKISDIAIANYWLVDTVTNAGRQSETANAYCYFYQSAGCASQASVMTSYMNTTTDGCTSCISGAGSATITASWLGWYNLASTCGGGTGCTPLGVRNYEGTYVTNDPLTTDRTVTVTSATNAAQAVLTANPNGGFVGQSVTINAAAGGTWSTVVGNTYTVQAASSSTITINLDSTGLGTLSSMTLAYVGSKNYINYFRNMAMLSPDLGTLTTTVYNVVAGTGGPCAPVACSLYPSQFDLSEQWGANSDWFTWSFDLYGYLPVATCTSCTISTTNLTLGGTVSGIFTSGLAVFGKGITTPTLITGACSQTGAGPAGSNAGDVCPLSASYTVSVGETMSGNAVPSSAAANPMTQWLSICTWNRNGAACQ